VWQHGAQENRTKPIVVGLTGREGEMDWHPVSIYDRVNLACQAAARSAHILLVVISDSGSVLVHAHNGSIDHLHRRVMSCGQRIHDPIPNAGPPPPDEAIITSGTGTIGLRQIAPWCTCA
jgi:hypothetical protein